MQIWFLHIILTFICLFVCLSLGEIVYNITSTYWKVVQRGEEEGGGVFQLATKTDVTTILQRKYINNFVTKYTKTWLCKTANAFSRTWLLVRGDSRGCSWQPEMPTFCCQDENGFRSDAGRRVNYFDNMP